MLTKTPRQLPAFRACVASSGLSRAQICRELDTSPRSLARWLADDAAPRPEHLCVYLATPWGCSVAIDDAARRLALAHAMADALRRELTAERALVARLLRLGGSFGAANEPVSRPA